MPEHRGMPKLSRSQILVYGAIAVALLFVGARAIRGEGAVATSFAESSGDGAAAGAGFAVGGQSGDVVVDVTGAVAHPGVYRLPAGSRVQDAVRRAGGAGPGAELESLNRAARLADGQQVVVPRRVPGTAAGVTAGVGEEAPISLGTATVEQLEEIDGIGPVTAEDIVAFREQHGGLASVEQLDRVSGIGPATMESLRAGLQP
jgi:competence protein ComEA